MPGSVLIGRAGCEPLTGRPLSLAYSPTRGAAMDAVEKGFQSQLNNIQTKTGRTLDQLYAILADSGLRKHGELRDLAKQQLGLGHGDANTLAKYYLAREAGGPPSGHHAAA